ncbi:MAG: hypothetical protein EAZ53_02545 [Bacteroidetes bacterium]|nr:MAG: hypothetical protein EAZ53_02545 [Bacteroidota bacterium]
MGLLISSILLVAFGILAVIDGFYLHIFKYKLFNQKESKFEHFTHTLRAILFPLIVYFLFVRQNCIISFYIGISLVIIDIIVLTMDAFVEGDSRKFMGGLPRWEYILHLFVNGFHFASIAVFLVLKLNLTNNGIEIVQDLSNLPNFEIFNFITINLIPGAILLAIIHIATSFSNTKTYWNKYREKITCC